MNEFPHLCLKCTTGELNQQTHNLRADDLFSVPLRKSVSTTLALKMLTTNKMLVRFKMDLNISCNSDQNNKKKKSNIMMILSIW